MQQLDKEVSVTWRRKNFILDMKIATYLKDLGEALQRLTNVKPDSMRLIVPTNKGSKLFYPFSESHSYLALEAAHILEGKSIMMMGVLEDEVDELIQNSKVNHRVAGFDEEEKRLRRRISDGKHLWPKLPEGSYIFSEFCTLDIPGIELNPPAAEALKLMHRLAADPGIVAIMTKHRWRVGIMSEMAPVGYVGVSPKCVLGFNKNHGEEISLRLRTDDLNGFRKYESIKKTLLHELAHMVYSEHDANFNALDKQLNEEATTLDWTKAKGYTLSGAKNSLYSEEEFSNHASSSQKVGGQTSAFSNARVASVVAARHRFVNASNNDLGPPHISEEPDGHDASHKDFEPAPDDNEGGESMEFESGLHIGGNGSTTEPHTDHSEVTAVPILTSKTSEELAAKDLRALAMDGTVARSETLEAKECFDNLGELKLAALEPDPDDSGLRENEVKYKDVLRPEYDESPFKDMKDETQLGLVAKSSCGEPDPDDSQASVIVHTEPDPDDNVFLNKPTPDSDDNVFLNKPTPDSDDNVFLNKPTPDSDDMVLRRIQDPVTALCGRLQKAIEMLQTELNPSTASLVLQTILRILRNMTEHPDELKFRKLRKANPIIQKNIMSHRAAMEILHVIGFVEDVLVDGTSSEETYLVLKRTDPGLLWLAKSLVESSSAQEMTTQ